MKVKSTQLLVLFVLLCSSGEMLFSQEDEMTTSPEAQLKAAQAEREMRIQEAITKFEIERAHREAQLDVEALLRAREYSAFIENQEILMEEAKGHEEEILEYLKKLEVQKKNVRNNKEYDSVNKDIALLDSIANFNCG